MKRLLLTAAAILLAATTLSAQTLKTQYYEDSGKNQRFFGYEEEACDDYYHYLAYPTQGTQYFHKFAGYSDIITGTVLNGISLTKNFTFEPNKWIGGELYYNVLVGWYDDSFLNHNDYDFRWFEYVDESNPHEMICQTIDWNIREDIELHAWVDFDSNRRLTHVKTDDGDEIWITYTKGGKIASYKDSYGYNFVFNNDGRLTSVTFLDGHTETYTYNKRGREDTRKYSDGRSYTNAYDDRNHLITRTWKDGVTTHWEYDGRGRMSRQYTEYAGCTVPLDEVTYEWNNAGNVCRETHSDGKQYLVTYDSWGKGSYTRYRIVDTDTLSQKMITYIPDDPLMFETPQMIHTYEIFADGTDIYLSADDYKMQDYILKDGTLKQTDLPGFTTVYDSRTEDIERVGNYIMGLNDMYWQNFDTVVQMDYNLPDDIRHEMYERGIYSAVTHSGRYVLPKGIVFHDEFHQDDSWCAIEYDGAQAVKFIPREEMDSWLAGQEGNFTLEAFPRYGEIVHRLFKDGKLYQKSMPVGYEQYHNGVGNYAGSVNGQFTIYEVYVNTYGIFDGQGKLVRYFKLPFGDNVKWTVDFAENGKLYAAVTPEFETVRITSWDDYYDEYHPVEGSKGKIVELMGHLDTFGYLNTDNVKITRTPQAKGAAIGTFDHDTTFEVLSQQTVTVNKKGATEDWSEIRLSDGTIGWVKSQYVNRF